MKKIIYIAAAALVALASCTKNEVNGPATQPTINFKAVNYKNGITKTAINDTKYPDNRPFGVFGYYVATGAWADADPGSTDLYMKGETNGELVTYSSTEKVYTPSKVYFWPLTGSLTFMAYSPYYVNGTSGTETAASVSGKVMTITDWISDADYTKQQDLMYTLASEAADETSNDTQYTYPNEGGMGVQLRFRHALSQVIFKAKTADDYAADGAIAATFKITKVSLTGLNSKGTMTVTDDEDDTTIDAEWSSHSTPVEYVAYTKITEYVSDKTVGFVLDNEYERVQDGEDDANELLIIPQSISTEARIKVTYTMTANGIDMGYKEAIVPLKTDAFTSFDVNKKYIINLIIAADQIYFSPEIVDWTDNDPNPEYNIPEDAE